MESVQRAPGAVRPPEGPASGGVDAYHGTRYFLALGIVYAFLYGLTRAFLASGVHAEWEGEYLRHAVILGILGWGALRRSKRWAWAGVGYLAVELLVQIVAFSAASGTAVDPHILLIKGFLLFMGYRSARKAGDPFG